MVKLYEDKAKMAYQNARNYSSQASYINSLVSYVECITYYTLAYHIYIDKLKDKDNFFRVSSLVLNISLESDKVADKAIEQTNDKNKKNNILNVKSSNYLNFASTLEKMYSVDYKIAQKKNEELKMPNSVILTISEYFAKSIDIQLSMNNYEKAKEYFREFEIFYKTLDNRIKDKYNVKKMIDFYKEKIYK
ncbi:MAG: hypothetical protein ACK4GJ_02900 [bacterium]